MLTVVNEVFHSGLPTPLFGLPSEAHSTPFLLCTSTICAALCAKSEGSTYASSSVCVILLPKSSFCQAPFHLSPYFMRIRTSAFRHMGKFHSKKSGIAQSVRCRFLRQNCFPYRTRTRITPSSSLIFSALSSSSALPTSMMVYAYSPRALLIICSTLILEFPMISKNPLIMRGTFL